MSMLIHPKSEKHSRHHKLLQIYFEERKVAPHVTDSDVLIKKAMSLNIR